MESTALEANVAFGRGFELDLKLLQKFASGSERRKIERFFSGEIWEVR
jgi:hypothetical protein